MNSSKINFSFFKEYTKKLVESIRGMLHKVYYPFVYGIHVTKSWLSVWILFLTIFNIPGLPGAKN